MTREEQIEQAADEFAGVNYDCETEADSLYHYVQKEAFSAGAEWADANLWHDAQGDDLPPIDKEVIVLCDDYHGGYKVCFGHRPYEYVAGVSYKGKMTYLEAKTYGKGEWNIPDVKWWLDVSIPNSEEEK